jgi:hypothetical protein
MRKGGGFGMIMLVIVLLVVMLLVAKNWQAVAPTAVQVSTPAGDLPVVVDDRGQTEAGAAVRSGQLPDLNDMRQSTNQHAQQVQDALTEID